MLIVEERDFYLKEHDLQFSFAFITRCWSDRLGRWLEDYPNVYGSYPDVIMINSVSTSMIVRLQLFQRRQHLGPKTNLCVCFWSEFSGEDLWTPYHQILICFYFHRPYGTSIVGGQTEPANLGTTYIVCCTI